VTGQVQVRHAGREIHLQAGQQCRYGDGSIQMTSDTDSSQILAWRSDLLIFHDQPLDAVIAELNRYRRGRVILTNSKLGRVRINGVFHLDRLDDVVEQIKDLGVSITTLPGGVILLS
jgi:transmembrane sensor